MKFISPILIISTLFSYALCDVVETATATATTKAIAKPLRFQHPEDVGFGHTEVMQDLHQRMRDRPPLDIEEYLVHMIDAVIEYMCKPLTEKCVMDILNTANNINMSYSNGFEHLSQNLLSKDFDSKVLESLEDLFFSIGLLDWDESPEDILHVMYKNSESLRNNHEVKIENHRLIGLVAYSVGIESAKQWHEILNEPDNEFHKFINYQQDQRRRNLQAELIGSLLETASSNSNIDSTRLVEADVIGGASGAIVVGFDRVVRGVENNSTIVEEALAKATSTAVVFSSANAVLQAGLLEGGDGNGTGFFGDLLGGTNGTGFLGGLFSGIEGNNTNNNGTGFLGGLFGGIGGNNNNNGNETGFLGGLLGGLGGNNTNNNGTGFLSGLLGGNNNNENNENTNATGGGLFSGVTNLIGGNNDNQQNSTNQNQGGDGGVFSGLIGGLTGNNNNNAGQNVGQVEENVTTNGDGGIFSGVTNVISNQPETSSNGSQTTAEDANPATGAVSNLIGGIFNNAGVNEAVATASSAVETASSAAETASSAVETASSVVETVEAVEEVANTGGGTISGLLQGAQAFLGGNNNNRQSGGV